MSSALLILLGLVVLLFTGLPIFAGLAIFGGLLIMNGAGSFGGLTEIIFNKISLYILVCIPLFTYMAHLMIRGRIVDDLYETAYTLTRHLPGGVGIATIAACMVFSAISGSSVATALTIGAVAIPQMIRYGYSPQVAYGLVAAGGTLGILIPPSGPMIIYGVATDTSIGGLFMAGLLPGLLLAGIFMLSTSFHQRHAKREKRATLQEIGSALRKSAWAIALPCMVLGGMYLGVFTATEASAIGAMLALLVGTAIYRTIGIKEIWLAAIDASRTSGMLFMILAGAAIFSHAITKMMLPQQIVEFVLSADMGVYGFLIAMMILILILGMFLESIAIILITSPVVLPALGILEISPIWYGVLLVINLELAMITPPVGMNLFTIKAVTGAPIGQIIRGAAPYAVLMIVGLLLVLLFPQLAMWLPSTML
ncbi:TRAP transporter large permease [Halomonas colorata]|uniref:TRAP transporter large permease n=1 Tax=Halomonas colorata TaxID=2742615 RepID=UPI001868EB26|nr:TRAP transporter large permease [Halomonas colorata]